MDAVGIIAEYNPFHNGHLYHLQKVKELFPDHVIVLILAGHFLQRGEPSIINKWDRCKLAIQYGVDLVVELPYPFASQSADFFAHGAISLLKYLEVRHLVFGSETDDIKTIETLVDTQLNYPEYDTLVGLYLKSGLNYPTALSKALVDLTGKKIDLPNDLLAISYIKEIKKQYCHIEAHCLKRINDYHDVKLSPDTNITSATSIRKALKDQINIETYVPHEVLQYLQTELHFIDDYLPFLKYKLATSQDLSIYQGVDEGIEYCLIKYIDKIESYDELIKNIKSKRYTYNKLQRMLCHILCGFTKEEANMMKEIAYIRILGFSTQGQKYLNSIKKNIKIPIISNYSKLKHPMLDLEFRSTKVYAASIKDEKKKKKLIEEEFKHHP